MLGGLRSGQRRARLGSSFMVECTEALARIQRNPESVGVDAYGVASLFASAASRT
jgi:hypothetical protein